MNGASLHALADLAFQPLLPWPLWLAGAAAAVLLLAFGVWRQARGTGWRAVAAAVILLALAGPRLVVERRQPLPDIAVVMVDRSPSQALGQRTQRTDAALAALKRELAAWPGLEVKIAPFGAPVPGAPDQGTRLFAAIGQAIAGLPQRRLAGIIALTDGQVQDAAHAAPLTAPLQVLLTGAHGEADRRIAVSRAPAYGIVGRPFAAALQVVDPTLAPGTLVPVTISRDGRVLERQDLPVGRPETVSLTVDHAGPTLFEFQVPPGPKELTLVNNLAVLPVNGVRDRLRVLLITGEPHPGARAWRDLLRSDPAVDLVQFTILRPPDKQDATPLDQLALIAFPVDELFGPKLKDFDLVVFDRYQRRGILSDAYLANIARYVENGGAVLVALGPESAGPLGLFNSPLGRVLPVVPDGRVIERAFRPALTDLGLKDPVTDSLPGPAAGWGEWYRLIEGRTQGSTGSGAGEVLMSGDGGRPLLVLNRVGKGRVAELMSDQIWLWARGWQGGGPQAELLRRVAHWLMKEPDLDEDSLRAAIQGGELTVTRRSLEDHPPPVTVTAPDGARTRLDLAESAPGRFTARVAVSEGGLYRVSDGSRVALAAAGGVNGVEMKEVETTAAKLAPAVAASHGSVHWLVDGMPALRRVEAPQGGPTPLLAGPGWIGLAARGAYRVAGAREIPLLPPALPLLLGLGALALAWWRESGGRRG